MMLLAFSVRKENQLLIFFQCCVAVNVWDFISAYFSRTVGSDFESVAALWLSNKKFTVCNIVSSAVLWVLWKLCNLLCFQGVPWMGMKKVFAQLGRMLRGWLPMFKSEVQEELEQFIMMVEVEASSAPRIKWRTDSSGLVQSTARRFEDSGNVMMFACNRP